MMMPWDRRWGWTSDSEALGAQAAVGAEGVVVVVAAVGIVVAAPVVGIAVVVTAPQGASEGWPPNEPC